MKRFAAFLICISFLSGCGHNQPDKSVKTSKPEIHEITAEIARGMMSELNGYILLDVRTQEEYAAGRIEGAILMPHDQLAERAKTELPDKHAVILVYCRAGPRAAYAAKTLIELGYTNVYNFGGINNWPYETVSD